MLSALGELGMAHNMTSESGVLLALIIFMTLSHSLNLVHILVRDDLCKIYVSILTPKQIIPPAEKRDLDSRDPVSTG